MAIGSDNKWSKLYLEERLADGSDTPTPAADHRALFLGEDGLLHLKDSAAAVTGVGGGSAAFKGVLVEKNTTQSITDSTYTDVTWTTEVKDADGWFTSGTSTVNLVAPYNCAVQIKAKGYWEPHATSEREMFIMAAGTNADYCIIPGSALANHTQVAEVPYFELTTGQIVKLVVAQYRGGALLFGDNSGVNAYLFVEVLELL